MEDSQAKDDKGVQIINLKKSALLSKIHNATKMGMSYLGGGFTKNSTLLSRHKRLKSVADIKVKNEKVGYDLKNAEKQVTHVRARNNQIRKRAQPKGREKQSVVHQRLV